MVLNKNIKNFVARPESYTASYYSNTQYVIFLFGIKDLEELGIDYKNYNGDGEFVALSRKVFLLKTSPAEAREIIDSIKSKRKCYIKKNFEEKLRKGNKRKRKISVEEVNMIRLTSEYREQKFITKFFDLERGIISQILNYKNNFKYKIIKPATAVHDGQTIVLDENKNIYINNGTMSHDPNDPAWDNINLKKGTELKVVEIIELEEFAGVPSHWPGEQCLGFVVEFSHPRNNGKKIKDRFIYKKSSLVAVLK